MIGPDDKKDGRHSTREIILDATESILSRDGHAAVSSRRISQEAGLKSRTIHYYFGSMDELFIAVSKRCAERHFAAMERNIASASLSEVWTAMMDNINSAIVAELSALATHRTEIRKEVLRTLEDARRFDARLMARFIEEAGIRDPGLSPTVLAVLMAGVVRVLKAETDIGMTSGHAEVLAYITSLLNPQGAPQQSLLSPPATTGPR